MRAGRRRLKGRGALVVLAALMVVTFVLLASGAAFGGPPWSDASNAWWMASYGVTDTQAATVADGYPDGTFRPALDVNRGQFAKMVVDGMGVPTANPAVPTFSDVPRTNFFYPWIEGGSQAGILSGFGNGTFGPKNNIVRQQADSILGSYLAQKELNLRGHIAGHLANYPSLNTWYLAEGVSVLSAYADANRLASVHAPATAYLVMKGVVEGSYSAGFLYLSPASDLTRAQAVALILRVQGVTFSTALPTVTNLNPSSGLPPGGNTVVITGTNFTDVTSVAFGTTNVTFTVNSATQITVTAPAGTLGTVVDVTVTTAAGTSATSAASKYTYGLPTLTGLNPASGPAAGGNTVIITGTNLTGATAVKFGTSNATSFTVNSSTSITAKAPAGSAGTTVDVTVTAPGGTTATSAASKYSYGIPVVTLLNPNSGPAAGGTTVVITGTGFTGVSSVKFGTKAATTYTVNSPTSITVTAPSATVGVVDVTVTTSAGTSAVSAATKYTYTGPIITLLTPSSGPATGGNTVVITGSGFSGATVVMFGTQNAPNFIVDSSTQIRVIAPAGTNGTTVFVTVTTASGTSGQTDASKYNYGIPIITDLTPSAGPASGGNLVVITGSGFSGATSVKFGGVSASFTIINSTQINAVAPGGTNGSTVEVTVTTPGGTSSTTGTANDYTYGADHFKVTMSGGNIALSAVAKTAGVPFSVRVTALRADNTIISDFNGTVVLTSNAWIGSVNAPITAGFVDGVVVTPKIAGSARTITATFDTVITANASGNFVVNANTVDKLQILVPGETAAPGTASGKTGTPTGHAAGASFNVTVNSVDAYWNVVSTIDTVHLTSTDGAAVLASNTPLVAGTKNLSVTLNTSGTQTVTASDVTHPLIDPNTSSNIPVVGTFVKLQILLPGETADPGSVTGKTGSPTAQTAGTTFSVRVNAVDANWNVVPGVTDLVHLTSTDGAASLPANTALVNGTKTLSVNLHTVGSQTITASDASNGGITANTSAAVQVNPGGLDHFGWAAISSPQTAGVDFGVTITAYDVYNNVKTNYAGSATLTLSNGGAVTPSTTTGGWVNGVWAHNVKVTKAGTSLHLTVAASPASNNSGDFDVVHGALSELVWQHSLNGTTWVTTTLNDGGIGGRYFRARLLDGWNNPLDNLNAGQLLAYDIDLNFRNDGGSWQFANLEDLPTYPASTDANGYVTFTYFFPAGGATNNDSYVWSDTNPANDTPDLLTEIISNTVHINFETP